jgi:hypothetical protein
MQFENGSARVRRDAPNGGDDLVCSLVIIFRFSREHRSA